MLLEEKVILDESVKHRIEDNVVVDPTTGCWNWARRIDNHGYGKMSIKRQNHSNSGNKYHSSETVIRVVYTIYTGPIPPGLVVRHSCNNRRCVNPSHLLLGTVQDNADDMVRANRQCRGERQHLAVLTEDQVREIRKLCITLMDHQIASIYECSPGTIWFIRKGITWKHIT